MPHLFSLLLSMTMRYFVVKLAMVMMLLTNDHCINSEYKWKLTYRLILICFQHANEDVEKMILGNKCDMEDKRQVPRDRGETVSFLRPSRNCTSLNRGKMDKKAQHRSLHTAKCNML